LNDPRLQGAVIMPQVENLGFCRACNLGAEALSKMGVQYLWLLNQDTQVAEDCLEVLLAAAETLSEPGILCGKILYQSEPSRIWFAGGVLKRHLGVGVHWGHNQIDQGQFETPREVSYATGCSMFMPLAVFQKVGGLREDIFMYLDDAEFCLKLKNHGIKIHYEPRAVIRHEVGPGQSKRMYSPYYLYFSIRNKPRITTSTGYGLYLHVFAILLAATKVADYLIFGIGAFRWAQLRGILLGAWDSMSLNNREKQRFPNLFRNSNEPAA
jgi:GT2 family glycosyltransferase